MRFLFFGTDDHYGLCPSYLRACKALGIEHELFDYIKVENTTIPYGKVGRKLFFHFNIENWVHKINRKFVIRAQQYKPTHIIAVTNAPITPASILFLKSVLPGLQTILLWPDSLNNFKNQTVTSLPLYDHIALYGEAGKDVLKKLTSAKITFVPLAGDPAIHDATPSAQHTVDFGFVGGWRPERQRALDSIQHHFPDAVFEIHGPQWKEQTKKSNLQSKVKSTVLVGQEMASFFNRTKINLNIIDDTNYPSANMRFFEIPTAGGLELVSSCPEMNNTFKDREHVLYFSDENSLLEQANWALQNPDLCMTIRQKSYDLIREAHTYHHRLQQIVNQLS